MVKRVILCGLILSNVATTGCEERKTIIIKRPEKTTHNTARAFVGVASAAILVSGLTLLYCRSRKKKDNEFELHNQESSIDYGLYPSAPEPATPDEYNNYSYSQH